MSRDNGSADWPSEGLQAVGSCPMCRSVARTVWHDGLTDRIFMTAPGRWRLYRCAACSSAYLDPRPTAESLPLAYAGYYTHAEGTRAAPPTRPGIRQKLSNGYINWRFGAALRPAWRLGVVAALLSPRIRTSLDARYRRLPRLRPGAKVLDVGCGTGAFLDLVRASGWEALGVDFDPGAVEAARARGLNVRLGDITSWNGETDRFDAISFNHVIEHLPDPGAAITAAFNLLKPGGTIHMELPNVDAWGLEIFGEDWRGLEPPRHLVLPSRRALADTLTAAGFEEIRFIPIDTWASMEKASLQVRDRRLDGGPESPARPAPPLSLRSSGRAEFFAFTARRPR